MINKKVAILQSNYIPWKGYFDIIASVDEFILYDEMQYTSRDWRNRNKIKTANGLKWLSIPVNNKGHQLTGLKINEVTVMDTSWIKSHWETIKTAYKKAPYFKEYKELFEEIYNFCYQEIFLSKINYKFITAINRLLDINTKISYDNEYGIIDGKTERLVDLVKKANGTEYLSGPAAKSYIVEDCFLSENIKLSWMDYSGYKEYPQLFSPFEHYVSILDLIFNCGPHAREFMKVK